MSDATTPPRDAAALECRVLGPAVITVRGDPPHRDLLHKKNLALLVYLARSPARSRTREQLMELLWPDRDEKTARHSLREAIRVIKRHAGDDVIVAEPTRVRLEEGAVGVDIDELERLRQQGAWREAVQLVRGEFLEGFSVPGAVDFDHWLTTERMAWAHVALEIRVAAARDLKDAGRIGEAVQVANEALTAEPDADAAIQIVMTSLALAGDRAGALARYHAFVERLRGFDAVPDAVTQQLAERVREEREWQPAETAKLKTGAETRRAPLVGRSDHLRQLAEAWARTRADGVPSLVLLEGDPGVGRTRIAEEFLARARLDGAITVTARAVAADLDEPWNGLIQLAGGGLANTPGAAGAAPEAVAVLAGHSEEWADRFPGGRREAPRAELGRAFREALRAVCREQEAVLVVDDAHWVDTESLHALDAMLRDLAGARVLLILTAVHRAERQELDRLRSRIGREVAGACVRLAPLSPAELRTLAEWAMPSYGPEQCDRLARRVATDSGGLPLLAVELLHAVAVGLDLERLRPDWPQPLRTLSQTLPSDLPEAAVGAIRVGFRRLGKAAQSVLVAAAVLGDRVPADRLAVACKLEGEVVEGALEELEWERWLVAEPRGYSLVAGIVRDVILRDMVTPGKRARILAAAGGG